MVKETRVVESFRYELSLDLLPNQVLTGCGFLWVNYDSAVTARGELLVFGTYDLEIRIAENYQNVAHHYIRYRTDSFREWRPLPGVTAANAKGVKADVRVAGVACEVEGNKITVTLQLKTLIHIPEPKRFPVVEKRFQSLDSPALASSTSPAAGLYADLEVLRAYVKRQVQGKVDVLFLNGVQVVVDEDTGKGER